MAKWKVPSQLENISPSLNTAISYLNFNEEVFKEKFGDRSEELMNALKEVNEWMKEETAIVHKAIVDMLNKVG